MKEKSPFYTLRGYQNKEAALLTASMEDYLEMMYRMFSEHKKIRVNELATSLNVRPSSVSKMVSKLKENDFVHMKKYSDIFLTEKGIEVGSYLLWRHNTLVSFLSFLNKGDYKLEQVEKIEHFIDPITLFHMEQFYKKMK